MRTRFLLSIGLAALVIACDKGPIAPDVPVPPPTATPAPSVTALTISGPTSIEPGETVQFSARAVLSDGSTASYTDKVSWRSNAPAVLTIAPGGHATGQVSGEVQVSASPIGGGRVAFANATVIPAGTYRLTGRVQESELPVGNATVAVISGQGTGLSTLTDSAGRYRLYGVAGPIQIQVSKPGYDSIVRGLTVSSTEILDITDLRQTGGLPSLAGAYTLTMAAVGACPTVPAEARSRTYAATLIQDGGVVHVSLSGADFAFEKNRFSGRVTPRGVTFFLSDDDYYSYLDSFTVVERLNPTTLLTFLGTADATIAADSISGSFIGSFAFVIPGPLGVQPANPCFGTHQFMLTRG